MNARIEAESSSGNRRIAFACYVIYMGTVAEVRCPRMMIVAFTKAVKRDRNFSLVLVGGRGGPAARDRLQGYASAWDFKGRTQFIRDVRRANLVLVVSNTVCRLSVMLATAVTRTISPTKLLEYLQFGCSDVASCGIREQDEIVRESGGSRLVEFDLAQVAEAITWMVRNEEAVRGMGRVGRDYGLRHRDCGRRASEVAAVFHGLATRPTRGSVVQRVS